MLKEVRPLLSYIFDISGVRILCEFWSCVISRLCHIPNHKKWTKRCVYLGIRYKQTFNDGNFLWQLIINSLCVSKVKAIGGHVKRAEVVAQLVERSLPTPEVRSSNPVISEIGSLRVNCVFPP